MASHEELISELPKLDKLSNAARLKAAKTRRRKQLKKYQDWVRQERASNGASFMKKRGPCRVVLEDGAMLSDMVSRNDIIGGESPARLSCGEGGGGCGEERLDAEEWLF